MAGTSSRLAMGQAACLSRHFRHHCNKLLPDTAAPLLAKPGLRCSQQQRRHRWRRCWRRGAGGAGAGAVAAAAAARDPVLCSLICACCGLQPCSPAAPAVAAHWRRAVMHVARLLPAELTMVAVCCSLPGRRPAPTQARLTLLSSLWPTLAAGSEARNNVLQPVAAKRGLSCHDPPLFQPPLPFRALARLALLILRPGHQAGHRPRTHTSCGTCTALPLCETPPSRHSCAVAVLQPGSCNCCLPFAAFVYSIPLCSVLSSSHAGADKHTPALPQGAGLPACSPQQRPAAAPGGGYTAEPECNGRACSG